MGLLNKPAYAVEKDRLIYDATHPIDASAVRVGIKAESGGVIKRGQVIDINGDIYNIHAENGNVSVIAAENVSYASDETEVTVPVYTSGTFRKSKVIAEPELTAADVETLREKGIYLK